MPKKEYKALFVDVATHVEIKVLSAKDGLTIDQTIKKLINFYEANI